ncbi:MAG: methyltransferase [Chitinophagaceae bacterium]|nr:methyltransferase [Chitinophagaceae bacterium]
MENANQPTLANIMNLGTGFWASKILLAALKLGLFTKLAQNKKMSAKDIRNALSLKCTDRHVYDFLDALTAFKLLNREGLMETAIYSNTPDTDTFLDKNKPSYCGGMLEMLNNRLYTFWGNLEEGLLTGEAQNEAKRGEDFFGLIYQDQDKLREFINAMTGIQMGNFIALAQKVDFSKYKTLVDIGGSAGLLSIMVAKHQPHMTCTTVDLPPVEPIARDTIKQYQLSDRVKTRNIDFFTDDFPKADVITMGNILHDWDEEKKLMLMKKAYAALTPGGAFIAVEAIIDDERKQNAFGLMMSLNMLIETATGFDYTFADFTRWAKSIGFKSTSILQLTGPSSAALAFK